MLLHNTFRFKDGSRSIFKRSSFVIARRVRWFKIVKNQLRIFVCCLFDQTPDLGRTCFIGNITAVRGFFTRTDVTCTKSR